MDIFSTSQLQQIITFPTLRALPGDEDDKQTFGQTVVSTFTYSLDFPWERQTIMIITHFWKIPLPFTYLAVLFPIDSKRTSHFSTNERRRKCRKIDIFIIHEKRVWGPQHVSHLHIFCKNYELFICEEWRSIHCQFMWINQVFNIPHICHGRHGHTRVNFFCPV